MVSRKDSPCIAVVIPCYKVGPFVLNVLNGIGPEVTKIFLVDDCCPFDTGKIAKRKCSDPRLEVIFLDDNQGVGGATMAGYVSALEDGAEIIVKLDGDGQMQPEYIPTLVKEIAQGKADYTKGNRFHFPEDIEEMPLLRQVGNLTLSFINKLVSGYWNIMDPSNGYTAIHSSVLRMLPLNSISRRYFFESDMLFRLGTVRAVVRDIPMPASYKVSTPSNLSISAVCLNFPPKYIKRFFKRIAYTYFVRDFNAGSLKIVFGLTLFVSGCSFGLYHWIKNASAGIPSPTGTIFLAALPLIFGFQLLLSALLWDISNAPKEVLQNRLLIRKKRREPSFDLNKLEARIGES